MSLSLAFSLEDSVNNGEHLLNIRQQFIDCLQVSDQLEISVGYASLISLDQLDQLVHKYKIKKVMLSLGMYYVEGIPLNLYNRAKLINEKWKRENLGCIKLVTAYKSHVKLYAFYKNDKVHTCMIGSANLSLLAPDSTQLETALFVKQPQVCEQIASKIRDLNSKKSTDIGLVNDLRFISETNHMLQNCQGVSHIPQTEVDLYKANLSNVVFDLPLKVPTYDNRLDNSKTNYTRSNVNVCFSSPRSKTNAKSRDWFEMQLTVSTQITRIEGYPEKNVPFIVVTDDGYMFKAHTTSSNNKQFSAIGNELILGRWLKGRLCAAGLVEPVADSLADTDRKSMITQEMLDLYGCDSLLFQKTTQKYYDAESQTNLDIWLLSFIKRH